MGLEAQEYSQAKEAVTRFQAADRHWAMSREELALGAASSVLTEAMALDQGHLLALGKNLSKLMNHLYQAQRGNSHRLVVVQWVLAVERADLATRRSNLEPDHTAPDQN